ncbi:DUF4397 domain-containing protein [bacterium]|nr:DUF4397 domain-containing protein [bacterium]
MQQKLLRKAGLLGMVLLLSGIVLTGCIDEPNPPVLGRITSEVRFVHAIPGTAAVDIWVDDEPAVTNVGYKGASDYLTVNSGNRFFRVVPAGQDSSAAIFRSQVNVRSLMKITALFHNTDQDVQLLTTQERFTYADETSKLIDDSCEVKLINLSLTSAKYGLAKRIGENDFEVVISPIDGGLLTPYLRMPAMSGDYFIARDGGGVVLDSEMAGASFENPHRYTVVVVGADGALELVKLLDE